MRMQDSAKLLACLNGAPNKGDFDSTGELSRTSPVSNPPSSPPLSSVLSQACSGMSVDGENSCAGTPRRDILLSEIIESCTGGNDKDFRFCKLGEFIDPFHDDMMAFTDQIALLCGGN